MKHIYELQLHEEAKVSESRQDLGAMGGTKIMQSYAMRVANGWIYRTLTTIEKNMVPRQVLCESTVFVPYSDEFLPKKTKTDTIPPR